MIKSKYGLSMLVLGHIPKTDNTLPLTNNSLAGSKQLMNFADSSFAIGKSETGTSIRYLKQIKVRMVEFQYTAGNVIICQITMPDNLTKFEFITFGKEADHLVQKKQSKPLNKKSVILFLYKEIGNTNQSDIARILDVKQPYVNKVITDARL